MSFSANRGGKLYVIFSDCHRSCHSIINPFSFSVLEHRKKSFWLGPTTALDCHLRLTLPEFASSLRTGGFFFYTASELFHSVLFHFSDFGLRENTVCDDVQIQLEHKEFSSLRCNRRKTGGESSNYQLAS